MNRILEWSLGNFLYVANRYLRVLLLVFPFEGSITLMKSVLDLVCITPTEVKWHNVSSTTRGGKKHIPYK